MFFKVLKHTVNHFCHHVAMNFITLTIIYDLFLLISRPCRARRSTKNASSASTVAVPQEEVNNSVYTKQFAHSKTQQYRKLKSEWRSNVLLGRSGIQVGQCTSVYINAHQCTNVIF